MTGEFLKANLMTMSLNLAYAIVAMAIGVVSIKVLDWVVFPEIDFIEEIKKGNLAAAIFASVLILFLAIMLSSAIG